MLCVGCFSKPDAPVAAGDAGSDSPGGCQFTDWSGLTRIGPNTLDNEWGPWLSPDGLDLWFSRATQSGSQTGVYHASRASKTDAFGAEVEVVLGLSGGGPDDDGNVFLSDDQLAVYWVHLQSSQNVLFATRSARGDAFGQEAYLGFDMDGTIDTYAPSLTQDQLTIAYAQGAHGAPQDHLFIATRARTIDDFASGTMIAGPPVAGLPHGTSLSIDGSQLFFADSDGNNFRLYSSDRLSATMYSTPQLVTGQPTGTSFDNIDPMLSRDGKTLVFAANDGGTKGYDLYVLTRDCR